MSTIGKFEDIFLDYTKDITQYSTTSKNDTFSENYGSKFGIFKELQTGQNCPYYELDAFINNDISDYEVFIEAIKTQKVYLSNRRTVRYQLDKLFEQFNCLDFSAVKDEKVRRIQQKLETLEIEFNEMDTI